MSLQRRLAALLCLEGLSLVVLCCWYGLASLSDTSDQLPAELAAGGGLLTGVVLLVLARGVDRSRSWARSPAVVLNVFPLPIALGVIQSGAWWAAVPLVLLSGSVLYLFATPELRLLFREG